MQYRRIAFAFMLGLLLLFSSNAAQAQYQLTNLVSNQFGAALHTDPLLVNAWGLVHAPGSPWWISDNNSGWSTLYNAGGVRLAQPLVEIPTANGSGVGSPTGIVFDAAFMANKEFQVQGWSSIFLFATLDGTISGWAPQSDFNNAIIAVTTPGASYTGLAITNKPSGNFLYSADIANNKVDMFDGNFKLVKSFTDKKLPTGFAPFGIRDIAGLVYVAFADKSGASGGFIDIFKEDGTFVKLLTQGAPLNQPWGFAVAPKNFGPLSNTLLISNNTNSGTINAFNALTGNFVGAIKDTSGHVIHIDQLWGIDFGDGMGKNGAPNQLFFTAGPDNNFAGTLGSIVFK